MSNPRINLGPNDQVVWPVAELRMIAEQTTSPIIARTITGCLDNINGGGLTVLALHADAWQRKGSPAVAKLAATIAEYVEAAQSIGVGVR